MNPEQTPETPVEETARQNNRSFSCTCLPITPGYSGYPCRECLERELTAARAEVAKAKAEAYSWEACVRVRENPENKSPCGHHMDHAYSPDGVGKIIRCYICDMEHARAEAARMKEERDDAIEIRKKWEASWHYDTTSLRSDLAAAIAARKAVEKERDEAKASLDLWKERLNEVHQATQHTESTNPPKELSSPATGSVAP